MSDVEQAAFAAVLEAASSPLQDAADRRQQAEQAEYDSQLAYQTKRKEVKAMREQLPQLALQESRAASKALVRAFRDQARDLAPTLHRLEAEETALDDARRQANTAMLRAQHGHLALADTASAAYRQMRRGVRQAANRDLSPLEAMDAEELAEQAFKDLCGLVGESEATRLRTSNERPHWLRG